MVKFLKRIISVFFVVVITFTTIVSPVVQAAWYNDVAYYYTQSRFGPWAMETSLQLLGLLGDVYVPEIPGIGTLAATAANKGINSFAEWLAAGHTEDELYAAEEDYVSTLPSPGVSSDGLPVYYPSGWSETGGYLSMEFFSQLCGGYSFSGYSLSDVSSSGPHLPSFQSDILYLPPGTYQVNLLSGVSLSSRYVGGYYCSSSGVPVAVISVRSAPLTLTITTSKSGFKFDSLHQWSHLTGATRDPDTGEMHPIYSGAASYCVQALSLTDPSSYSAPDASTRPSSLMQFINNYNSPDNSTNYFIGSIGEGGNVTNIYNVNLYDEGTKIFTEPVTGAQYQTTGWVYDYNTRTYQLSLASGTFYIGDTDIDRIDLTYGDDELTISYYSGGSLVTTDTYAYVIATEHQHSYTSEITTEATCTTPGMVTYTCSTCGHQYTEELPLKEHTYTTEITIDPTCTDPGEQTYTCTVCGNQYTEPIEALGHDWKLVETVPAVKDEDGNVIEYSYDLYECARCKERYMDYDQTGPPSSFEGDVVSWLDKIYNKLCEILEAITSLDISTDETEETQESWFTKLISKFGWLTSVHTIYKQLAADVVSDASTAAAVSDGTVLLADVTTGHAAVVDDSTQAVTYTAPELAISFGSSDKYGVDWENVKAIDLSWYAPYKETVDGILSGILWLSYLFLLIKRAPGIIRGSEMVTEDSIKIDLWRSKHDP